MLKKNYNYISISCRICIVHFAHIQMYIFDFCFCIYIESICNPRDKDFKLNDNIHLCESFPGSMTPGFRIWYERLTLSSEQGSNTSGTTRSGSRYLKNRIRPVSYEFFNLFYSIRNCCLNSFLIFFRVVITTLLYLLFFFFLEL